MELYERGTIHRGPRELLLRALEIMDSGLASPPAAIAGGGSAGDGAAGAGATPGRNPAEGAGPTPGGDAAAMSAATRNRHALDLGAGLGQETEELLRRGWRVTATDASRRMLDSVRARADRLGAMDRLTLIHADFSSTPMGPGAFDLVHAGFALPFTSVWSFEAIWMRLRRSIRPGGLFVGQFFGPRDEFVTTAPHGSMTAHDAAAVQALLAGMEILVHEEVERMGQTAPGTPKYWHVHHVVARVRERPS